MGHQAIPPDRLGTARRLARAKPIFVPYPLFRSQFILKPEDAQTLNDLLGTEALLLGIFALLLWLKK